jgi:hypothetical protein
LAIRETDILEAANCFMNPGRLLQMKICCGAEYRAPPICLFALAFPEIAVNHPQMGRPIFPAKGAGNRRAGFRALCGCLK